MIFRLSDFKEVGFSRNIVSLYFTRLLIQLGFNIVGVFLPIFFFTEFFESIYVVISIFVGIYFGVAFLTPIGARVMSKIGIKRCMMLGIPFAFLSTASLFFWESNPFTVLGLYILFMILYKVLYWTPYHVDFVKFTDSKKRGRQLSLLRGVSQIALAIAPLVGGFIISFVGFKSLFLLSAAFFVVAIYPTLFIDSTFEKFTFSYFGTFRRLFSKENRSMTLAYAGSGAETGVHSIIWPIFIFILLSGEFLEIGIISSIVIFVLIFLRLFIGDLLDKWSKEKMLKIGSFFYTTGWIIKAFIETAFQIVLVDIYHKAGRVVNKMSFDVAAYDQAADNGHYVDEFTVLREISLNGGRAVMLVFLAGLIFLVGIKASFFIAAGSSLFMTLLTKKISVH